MVANQAEDETASKVASPGFLERRLDPIDPHHDERSRKGIFCDGTLQKVFILISSLIVASIFLHDAISLVGGSDVDTCMVKVTS